MKIFLFDGALNLKDVPIVSNVPTISLFSDNLEELKILKSEQKFVQPLCSHSGKISFAELTAKYEVLREKKFR